MKQKRPHRIVRQNGMRLAWTNTSRIPDADIVDALKFLARLDVNIDKTIFHFKKHGHNRATLGLAYPRIPRETNLEGLVRREWRNLVIVTDRYSGNRDTDIIPMDDAIFNTLAHEAKHVEDFRHYGLWRKGVQWERKARAYADWAERKWLEYKDRV